jgi:hypothetical protein
MIPAPSDARWTRAVTSASDLSKATLATRMLVSRLRREVSRDPGKAAQCARELHAFMSENGFAQDDVAYF